MMRRQPAVRVWMNVVMGIALSIAAMEIVLHAIERTPAWRVLPVVEQELGWPNPDTGYALRANHEIINVRENRSRVRTNSFGLRDRERALVKAPGTYRVVLTGDSFTEALQVDLEETFAVLAEDTLNAGAATVDFEIMNFGMSGAGPVQQLVRLQQDVLRFSPDAVVMLIDANHLLSSEMSDDSANPAYVVGAGGDLEFGYAFRSRRSQRLRETFAGELFFALMDHSRIARALYLRYLHGGALAAPLPPAHGSDAVRPCAAMAARLAPHVGLWRDGSPTHADVRLRRFLLDLAAFQDHNRIPVALVFYGVGEPRGDCSVALERRTALRAAMSGLSARYGLAVWDADAAVARHTAADQALSELRGFGRRRGFGHLNHGGHRAYAEVLSEIVAAFEMAGGRGGDH